MKSCVFVRNKYNIKSIIMYPPVKKSIPCYYVKIKPFCTVFACKRHLNCAYCSPDSDKMTFSLNKAILWIVDYILARSSGLKFKYILMMDLFLTNMQLFISQDVNWFTGLLYFYQLFELLFWWHPFTAGDPFVSKQCSDTFLNYSFKTIYFKDVPSNFS